MEPGYAPYNPHPDWLFNEPAPRARRRQRFLRLACIVCSCVVVVGFGLAFAGNLPAILAALIATVVATGTGIEACWAGEIARRGEARAAA